MNSVVRVKLPDWLLKIQPWYIVFLNALVGCAMAACFPQFSMTLGPLEAATKLPRALLLMSDTVKACGIVLAMLISGVVYKKFGARKVFIFSVIATALPQFVIPHISSGGLLLAIKFFQGLGSVIFPIFLVIILNWMDENHAGLSTAIFNGIFYGGGGIGGTLTGFIIAQGGGWQASYYVLAFIVLALALLWCFTVRERPAMEKPGKKGPEPRSREKALFADPRLWLLALGFFATTWSLQLITVDMAIYGEFLGFDEIAVGKVLTGVTIAMIASCLVSGRASDFFAGRTNRKARARLLVLLSGYSLILLALGFLIILDTSRFFVFYAVTFLFTFGAAWGLGVFYSILSELYDEEKVPLVTGITGGIGDAGMPLAPFVVGFVFGIRGLWNLGWAFSGAVTVLSMAAVVILLVYIKRNPAN
jgi:NNP family nitrate/nitrite transporter-like MFS transporter